MLKHGRLIPLFILLSWLLSGCLNSVWTGANMIYNRHHLYKKFNDYQLAMEAQQLLFSDKALKQPGCNLDLAVFNGDVLLAGQVRNEEMYQLILDRIKQLRGYRRLYKQITVQPFPINNLDDTWITTKIRSQMIADADIDPALFKVITVGGVVYIMGDAEINQAKRVLELASHTNGVIRVVKLLRCYSLNELSVLKG